MIKYIGIAWLLVSVSAYSQPLRDINYEYLYNPDAFVSFELKPVRGDGYYTILYALQVKDTLDLMNEYSIDWEGRDQLSDKDGTPLLLKDDVHTRNRSGFSGHGIINLAEAPQYLVARVIKTSVKRAWLFYIPLLPNYPVNGFLVRDGSTVTESWIHTGQRVVLANGANRWTVSYYNDDFPAAAPAFSEAQSRVSPAIASDSVYQVPGGEAVNFSNKGLYLLQKDTTSVEGFAFRAEADYPQYSKLVNLSGPLIYISTRQEYERLSAAKENKRAFDRVILSIASDTDRARTLMRNYFRRVELANRFFTSYKEGWKTDRGMIYIIFGKPDEVFRFNDREIWNYDNDQFEIRLTFSRASSLFDPDNYVLIREEKYESTWYEVVDLWRKGRF